MPRQQAGEERCLIPLASRLLISRFPADRLLGLTDHARHERLEVRADKLLDFDGEYLGRVHLSVQEFDDASELGRNLISYEHEADAPSLQIRLDPLPEFFRSALFGQ